MPALLTFSLILVLVALALLIVMPAVMAPPIFDDLQLPADPDFGVGPFRRQLQPRWRLPSRLLAWSAFRYWGRSSPWLFPSLRLVSVLFHIINSIIIYTIAITIGRNDGEAAMAALVVVAHPLATAATLMVLQQSTVLATTFLLATLFLLLTAHPVVAALAWLIAVWNKEDTAATLPLVLWLSWPAGTVQFAGMLALAVLAGGRRWEWLQSWRHRGDAGMAAAHMPTSLPQPAYTLTAVTENLRRFPLWALGFGQSVHPAPTVRSFKDVSLEKAVLRTVLIGLVVSVSATLYIRMHDLTYQFAILLILANPWTGSWLVRLPDPVMEYRAYSTVGGIALLVAPLARFPVVATLYIAWCAGRAAQRSFFHRHPVPFWLSAWASGAQTPKVALNIGSAFQAAGRLPEALEWHKRTLALDPQAGVAAVNIGLLLELQARLTGNLALLPEALAAARAGRAMCSQDPLVVQYAGMVEERCRAAGVT